MTTVPFVFFSSSTRLFAIVLANFWKHDEQREMSTSGSQKPQRMWTFGLREPRQSLFHVPYWVDEASVKAQQDIDTIRGRDAWVEPSARPMPRRGLFFGEGCHPSEKDGVPGVKP